MGGPKKLDLSNICGGAAAEVFEREVGKMLENIADPNTKAEATRKLTLSFVFKPNEQRDRVDIRYDVTSKLPGVETKKSSAFIAMDQGELALYGLDPRQGELPMIPDLSETVNPNPEPAASPKVRSISAGAGA